MKKKYGVELLNRLEENGYYMLPNYPFIISLDEVIAETYWNEEVVDEAMVEKIETYSKWCLDNWELVVDENR